jgi:serine/threonine protein kinase
MNEEIIVNGMNKINKRKYESLSQSNIVYNDYNNNISKLIKEGSFQDNLNLNSPEYQLKNLSSVKINNSPYILSKNEYHKTYLFKNKNLNKFFSLMRISKETLNEFYISESQIKNSLKIYSKITHENIQKLYSIFQEEKFYFLILEYIPKGNLFQILKKLNQGLNENEIFSYFIQIINSIYFLHKNDIIFKNITSKNYLVTEKNTLKLSDFILCCKEGENTQNSLNYEYYSPDLIENKNYTKEDDIWAIGILLYEMYFGRFPFNINVRTYDKKNILNCIKNNSLNFSYKQIDDKLKNLIQNMLHINKNKRIKIEEIFQNEWVKKYEYLLYGEPENYSNNDNNTKKLNNIQNGIIVNINKRNIDIIKKNNTFSEVNDNNQQEFLDKVLNNIQNHPKKIKKKSFMKQHDKINSLQYVKTEANECLQSIEEYHNKLQEFRNDNEFIMEFNKKHRVKSVKKNKNNNKKVINKNDNNNNNNNNNNINNININNINNIRVIEKEDNKNLINRVLINDEQKLNDAINMIENANKINNDNSNNNLKEPNRKKVNLVQPSFWERFLSNFSCK